MERKDLRIYQVVAEHFSMLVSSTCQVFTDPDKAQTFANKRNETSSRSRLFWYVVELYTEE